VRGREATIVVGQLQEMAWHLPASECDAALDTKPPRLLESWRA
jgi:hypothetical protein